jgi:hypothetical protein
MTTATATAPISVGTWASDPVHSSVAVAAPIDPTGSARPFHTSTGPRWRNADES